MRQKKASFGQLFHMLLTLNKTIKFVTDASLFYF